MTLYCVDVVFEERDVEVYCFESVSDLHICISSFSTSISFFCTLFLRRTLNVEYRKYGSDQRQSMQNKQTGRDYLCPSRVSTTSVLCSNQRHRTIMIIYIQ
ncbi:uncharacterized protein EURHEDRAFT_54197 [Aspergillus ruber CBS 135680]|uniref:Uncharacterized protein n=1 Tax=Aspergillus ruber (strain CBS 135680) TaxID=1388766 RepID=A0A017SE92_ASPRC|nr:uncharacterized protein EURHEDRAFT_54197 [Aspergillus ruber CBS 135680]EYE95287.1 hypothetical protein EURHEDRAFT_54197 [Aspergillus ruber CBS 135680]